MILAVGITTTPQRPVPEYQSDYLTMIHNDYEGIGVSRSRNNLIKTLYDAGADYICIMDDDVRILRKGWFEYAVKVMQKYNVHFVGLPNNFTSKVEHSASEIIYWSDLIGAFHIFSRAFVEQVGYFNTAYDRYGFEDSEMQYRARKSGMTGILSGLPCPLRLPFYLMSEDVYGTTASQTLSFEEKQMYIEKNRPLFIAAVMQIDAGRLYWGYNGENRP